MANRNELNDFIIDFIKAAAIAIIAFIVLKEILQAS
jgi:hypothetical protein